MNDLVCQVIVDSDSKCRISKMAAAAVCFPGILLRGSNTPPSCLKRIILNGRSFLTATVIIIGGEINVFSSPPL